MPNSPNIFYNAPSEFNSNAINNRLGVLERQVLNLARRAGGGGENNAKGYHVFPPKPEPRGSVRQAFVGAGRTVGGGGGETLNERRARLRRESEIENARRRAEQRAKETIRRVRKMVKNSRNKELAARVGKRVRNFVNKLKNKKQLRILNNIRTLYNVPVATPSSPVRRSQAAMAAEHRREINNVRQVLNNLLKQFN
jgi:hypothetical protein